jgi:hypothetical protein
MGVIINSKAHLDNAFIQSMPLNKLFKRRGPALRISRPIYLVLMPVCPTTIVTQDKESSLKLHFFALARKEGLGYTANE